MTEPTDRTDPKTDSEEVAIAGWQPTGGATIRAVPTMSDQFFRLAQGLRNLSYQHPNDVSLPAGTVLISIATLEAYINELAEVSLGEGDRGDFDRLGDKLRKKLRLLDERGEKPGRLNSEVEKDIGLLYGLRGILMHYRADPEHPVETKTSLQGLAARFPKAIASEGDVSTQQLLTPRMAEWAVDRITQAIVGLYKCGWGPPRSVWLKLLDPDRLVEPDTVSEW